MATSARTRPSLALTGASGWILHGVGLLFLAGRALHAFGLSRTAGSSMGRVGGMLTTHAAFFIGAGALLAGGLLR
jgi:uncharacterized protein